MNLLSYNSWAVLIKDESEESKEIKIIKALLEKKYRVVAINPKKYNLEVIESYESLKDVPHNIDVVTVIQDSIEVYGILEEMELLDIHSIWIDKEICNERLLKACKEMKLNIECKLSLYKELKL